MATRRTLDGPQTAEPARGYVYVECPKCKAMPLTDEGFKRAKCFCGFEFRAERMKVRPYEDGETRIHEEYIYDDLELK